MLFEQRLQAIAVCANGVKHVPKYSTIWRRKPNAPWPPDPTEAMQLDEMTFAFIDKG